MSNIVNGIKVESIVKKKNGSIQVNLNVEDGVTTDQILDLVEQYIDKGGEVTNE